jgi:hypothetical protein
MTNPSIVGSSYAYTVKADMAMKPEERMTDLEISGALATFMVSFFTLSAIIDLPADALRSAHTIRANLY